MGKTKLPRLKKIILCLFAAMGVGILAAVCRPLFAPWENIILDWHLSKSPAKANSEKIVLILGGDKSMAELDSWPWPRENHARLISDRLSGAKAIALDIFLVDKTTDSKTICWPVPSKNMETWCWATPTGATACCCSPSTGSAGI